MPVKLNWNLMVAVHRGEVEPGEAFKVQIRHDEDIAAGRYRPDLDSLAPYMTTEVPPPMAATTEDQWTMEVPRILSVGGETIRELLAAHESMIESRTDLTPCQKNAKRGVILRAWYASAEYPEEQMLRVAEPRDTLPVAVADVSDATTIGAGMR